MIVINEKFLSIFKDDTKIVPGHGPISSKADVITFRDMLVISRDRMAKLIAEGKATSEAEAQALKPFADLDAKWAANEQASKKLGAGGVQFIEAVSSATLSPGPCPLWVI